MIWKEKDVRGKAALWILAALPLCAFGGPRDTRGLLNRYVEYFNSVDDEPYTNAIPNSAAKEFLQRNIPRFACPDQDIERTYYFRWWTFRKHLRHDLGVWTVTEFLPKVGWAGIGNTIVCPAGHHFQEGRWLRDPAYIAGLSRFWLSDSRSVHRWKYASWLYTGVCRFAEVSGLDDLPAELLDAAIRYFERWEQGFVRDQWPEKGAARIGGDGDGAFLSIANYEGSEFSLGGYGYRPLLNSAMWSEAHCISKVARMSGRTECAETFASKAESIAAGLTRHGWNDQLGFFTTGGTNGVKGTVRELHGYAPWYFEVPVGKCKADWHQLVDKEGFWGTCGLSFPERRAEGFAINHTGHPCQWNGPSWPFATSIALTALSNDLHRHPSGSSNIYFRVLHQYAAQHQRVADGGTRLPWIDENCDPDTGEWLCRSMLLRTARRDGQEAFERGKDYNHSTFCDLVISGLVGFIPNGAEGFIVDPIIPEDWAYFALEDLRYRHHDISIRWEKNGCGFAILVDGRVVSRQQHLGKVKVSF